MRSNRVKGIQKALKDMLMFASGRTLEDSKACNAPEKPAEKAREMPAQPCKPHPGVMEELEKLLDSFIF